MATTKGPILKPFITLLLITAMLMFAAKPAQSASAGTKQDAPNQKDSSRPKSTETPKPGEKHESGKPNQNKHYTLKVVVHTEDAQSPVEGAKVRIHAGEYDEERRTNKEGIVRFEFDTNGQAATLRVTADHFATYQQLIALQSTMDVKIIIKKDQ